MKTVIGEIASLYCAQKGKDLFIQRKLQYVESTEPG